MMVVLLSIPFILIAVYFLFFHQQYFGDKAQNGVNTETGQQQNAGTEKNTATDTKHNNSNGKANANNTTADTNATSGTKTQSGSQANSTADSTANSSGNGTQTGPAGGNDPYLILAEEYFKNKDYAKARENLELARKQNETPEVKAFEAKLNQQLQIQNQQEYMKRVDLATAALDKGKFEEARSQVKEAEKYKSSEELVLLIKNIENAEKRKTEKDRKARIAAERRRKIRQKDDAAFNEAVHTNTIVAYEKYMKRHARGHHIEEVTRRHKQLKESILLEDKVNDDTAFEMAGNTPTILSYEGYLRKFPFGRHVKEANAKIEALKQKRLKETTNKLAFQEIKFFQHATKSTPPQRQRVYGNRFSQLEARFIFSQLTVKNNLYRVAEFRIPVTLNYANSSGSFKFDSKGTVYQDKGSATSIYCRGMGWSTAGKWLKGTYTVTVFFDGKEVGKGRFEIY